MPSTKQICRGATIIANVSSLWICSRQAGKKKVAAAPTWQKHASHEAWHFRPKSPAAAPNVSSLGRSPGCLGPALGIALVSRNERSNPPSSFLSFYNPLILRNSHSLRLTNCSSSPKLWGLRMIALANNWWVADQRLQRMTPQPPSLNYIPLRKFWKGLQLTLRNLPATSHLERFASVTMYLCGTSSTSSQPCISGCSFF